MPTYTMRAPDGRNYSISGPAGATPAQVQQQILAQHPQAGVAPAAGQQRPTLKAPPQPQQNWFQRLSSGVGNAIDTYAHPVAAAFRGVQDGAFGGIADHIAAGANELGTVLHANSSNMTYSQRVQALRAQREAQLQDDAHGNSTAAALAHYVGEGAGMIGAGVAGGAAVRGAGLVAAPAVSTIGRVGQAMAAGGAAGAVQGAGNATTLAEAPKDIAEGATIGAVAAPVVGAGAKFAGALAGRVSDLLGVTNAASILKRYISTSADQIEANRAAAVAAGNPNPTIFELLPLADRQQAQKLLNIVPTASKEQAAGLIQQRAAAMGKEVSDHVATVVQPQRQAIIDKMAQDLATSRGDTVPTNEDITLATKASRDPNMIAGRTSSVEKGGQPTVNSTINKNIMSPHDDTQIPSIQGHDPVTGEVIPSTVNDLVPQHPVLGPDGQPGMAETRPDISKLIRKSAGVQNLDKSGVTVSDLTSMVSDLRDDANNASMSRIDRTGSAQAADHLMSLLPEDAAAAHEAMTASHQHYSQMKEGYGAGLDTQLQQNVAPTTDVQGVQNQYVSQGGADGRLLGQASALDQQLGQGVKSLAPAADIANNPATQAAIDSNIPGAGQQIASAAQSQTQSAQRLSELNPTPNDQGGGLPAMAANLMRMASFSPAAKVHAGIQIMRALHPLPAEQSSQIVDALFSQNPTKIDMGLKFLNNSGQPGAGALSQLQTALQGTMTSLPVTTGGAGAVASAMTAPVAPQDPSQDPAMPPDPTSDPSAAPAMPADVNADPAAPPPPSSGPLSADPTAANASPYAAQLQDAYAKADPKLLSLANSVAIKESGGQQFNKDGTPKISNKGAVGLMQVEPTSLPGIAKQAGLPVDQVALHNDPAYNTLIGLHYLDQNMQHFNGDAQKSAAAYNAGPGRVQHAVALDPAGWLSHMPDETQAYAGDIK